MKRLVFAHSGRLKEGKIVERPNRFTLLAQMNSNLAKVYLANTGALSTVVSQGNEILCEPAEGKNRKTDFDAFAIRADGIYVTVNSNFANTIFHKTLEKSYLSEFEDYHMISREPPLPDHGRADFLLEKKGEKAYVEVKSCTHVEESVAKFPDRPTERGRRHLRSLKSLAKKDVESHIVFVVQRPDSESFEPFKDVDSEFAKILKDAKDAGVKVHAISTEFVPPNVFLKNESLPINLD